MIIGQSTLKKKIVASIKNGSVKLSSSPSFPEKVTWRNIHMDISPYYSWAILCDWNSMIFISWYRNSYNGKISTLILQWVPEMRPIILQWHYKKHIWYFFQQTYKGFSSYIKLDILSEYHSLMGLGLLILHNDVIKYAYIFSSVSGMEMKNPKMLHIWVEWRGIGPLTVSYLQIS